MVTFSRGHYPSLVQMGITHFQGNLSDYVALKKAMTGCEAVFQVAAKMGSWGKYEDFYRINVTGMENVLQACRELGIRNLVYIPASKKDFGYAAEGTLKKGMKLLQAWVSGSQNR